MTCVVAIEEPHGRVVLGADSATAGGSTVRRASTPKVFVTHGIGYACAGSWRLINILRYDFVPPDHPPGMDPDEYMVVRWVNDMRARLSALGVMRAEHEEETTGGGVALIGYRGRAYHFDTDFQITRALDGHMAHGSGRDYALGSLDTTARLGIAAERRARLALTAAAELNWAVREPFTVLTVGGDDGD
jgi:20S proteasome alpha/beta subunit